jgi:hypothetical protein
MFAAGKVGMFHSARSTLKSVRQAVGPEDSGKFKWSTIGLPEGPNFNKWGLSLNTHAGTSQSQHKLESFKLTYALSDARFAYLVANEIGYLVGRQNELDEIGDAKDDPFIQLQYEQQAKGTPYRIGRNYRGMEFESVIKNTLDQVWLGAAEPSEAFMSELDDAMDEILERPIS